MGAEPAAHAQDTLKGSASVRDGSATIETRAQGGSRDASVCGGLQ